MRKTTKPSVVLGMALLWVLCPKVAPLWAGIMRRWVNAARMGVWTWAWAGAAMAQTLDDPPAAVLKWVPAGLEVLQAQPGDLNGDAYPDVVLALRQPQLAEEADGSAARLLLLLLGQADGQYRLAARNDHVVMCAQCGGMSSIEA